MRNQPAMWAGKRRYRKLTFNQDHQSLELSVGTVRDKTVRPIEMLSTMRIEKLRGVLLAALLVIPGFNATPPTPSAVPYGVRIEHVWIPMKDGVRLAANLFMPTRARSGTKFPVLLEYLPYRKDDGTASRDYPIHSYFVHQGYVGARVDIRGTGQSEGQPPDREYSEQELGDGLEVIAWLAGQPWSNGNVGMFGISWGGFNSLCGTHRP